MDYRVINHFRASMADRALVAGCVRLHVSRGAAVDNGTRRERISSCDTLIEGRTDNSLYVYQKFVLQHDKENRESAIFVLFVNHRSLCWKSIGNTYMGIRLRFHME